MKRRIFLILTILSVILCLAAALFWYAGRNQSSKSLTRIELAIRAQKLDKAAELAKSYIAKYPDDRRGYHLLARTHIRSGRYEEARTLLEKFLAERGGPKVSQTSTILLLADTYAFPAKRSLFLTKTSGQTAVLKTAIEQLRQANKVIAQAETDDEAVASNLQQATGMNLADIGRGLLRLSDQFGKEAEIAAEAGAEHIRVRCLEQSEVALAEAQKVLQRAIDILLAVVTRDASRHDASSMLVQLCIQQGDRESLQAARVAILSPEKPAPIATMMLIVHDLKKSYEKPEYELAEREARKNDTLKAAGELDKLLEQYPDEIQIKLQRASLALMLSDLSTVERLVGEVLTENPRQGQARLIEAKMLLLRGDISQAETKLFSLKAEFLQWAEAHYIYAKAAMASGKKELARQVMRRVTELEPDHPGARSYLAESMIHDGFYEQAFLDAQAYYKFHPDNPVSVRLVIVSAIHTDQPDLAREILEKTRKGHSSDPIMLNIVAAGYAMLGDKTDALEVLRLAADSKPATVAGRLAKSHVLVRLGRLPEAEKILLDELSKDPQHPGIHFALGRVYADTGRNFQSLEQYREALRLDNNDDYRLAIARVLLEVGDLGECRQVLDEISSSNTTANLLRLQIRLIQGRPISSDEALQKMGFAGGLGVALAYLQSGRPEDCVHICQTEIARNRDSADVRLLLGQAHLALGQQDKCAEQFEVMLQMSPRKLSNYLLLARLLSRESGPEAVARSLSSIPDAESYMIDLTMGWLFENSGRHASALEAYDRVIETIEAPEEPRNLSRLFRARTLAAQGRIDQAIAELDKITHDRISGNRVDLLKARLLVSNDRSDEADILLRTLRKTAVEQRNRVLLKKLVALYLRLKQTGEALAVCDEIQRLFPQSPEPYLLQASILIAAERRKEAIECYRQAISIQPTMFGIYHSLAKALDNEQEPQQALAVLDDLESFGQSGRSAALFERGAMFGRWGLQTQAAECYEALAASGYGGNPKLQLFLGRTFASMGKKAAAIAILGKIPEYVSEYQHAQLLLAHLEDDTEKKLDIMRRFRAKNPGQVNMLLETINTLLASERADEALSVFRTFVEDYGKNTMPSKLRTPALHAILRAGDRQAAISLSVYVANQQPDRWWRHLAILLTMDEQPELTAGLLPVVSEGGFYDALLGLCFACRTKDTDTGQQWFNRINQLEKQHVETRRIPASYKILMSLAAGQTTRAAVELDRFVDAGIAEKAMASELVSYSSANNDRSEAAELLKAHVAFDLGIYTLAREYALSLLNARTSYQWAAALAARAVADKATLREISEILEPKDCFLAKSIGAELLLKNKEYEKVAAIYGELVAEGQDRTGLLLLNQGIALENAGKLAEALEIYRRVWETKNNPIAANNGAYVVSIIYPKDSEKLAEVQGWMETAMNAVPNEPTFHDTIGWISYLQGHNEQACRELRWTIKKHPDSAEVHYHLGMAEAALDHRKLARWHLEAAVHIGRKQQDEDADISPAVVKVIQLARQALQEIEQN